MADTYTDACKAFEAVAKRLERFFVTGDGRVVCPGCMQADFIVFYLDAVVHHARQPEGEMVLRCSLDKSDDGGLDLNFGQCNVCEHIGLLPESVEVKF